jgi:protein-S-isoprenylcysteine O-methyltransferase Ste14
MTQSASTPRLRATFWLYLALLVATAFVGPRVARGQPADLLLAATGFVLVVLACLGRIWCSVFVAGYKDERVISSGPYATCRHPLYSLSFVGALGLACTARSLTLAAILIVALAFLLRSAAVREEAFLASVHGETYRAYAASTPRWWPRLSQYQVPEQVELKPRVLWKAFLDAGSFLALYLLVYLAAHLRVTRFAQLGFTVP